MTSGSQTNDVERREGQPAVPSDLKLYLNAGQKRRYKAMQSFGWHMYFIRRPLFQQPTVVMINNDGTRVAVIEEDGKFDQETRIELRV